MSTQKQKNYTPNLEYLEVDEISPVRVKVHTPGGSSFRRQPSGNSSHTPKQKMSYRQLTYNQEGTYQNDSDDNQETNSKADSVGPSNGSTIYDEAVSRYESIAALTEEENFNLKEQNEYLLQQIRKLKEREEKIMKMYKKAKHYKKLYEESQIELESIYAERDAYKQQA